MAGGGAAAGVWRGTADAAGDGSWPGHLSWLYGSYGSTRFTLCRIASQGRVTAVDPCGERRRRQPAQPQPRQLACAGPAGAVGDPPHTGLAPGQSGAGAPRQILPVQKCWAGAPPASEVCACPHVEVRLDLLDRVGLGRYFGCAEFLAPLRALMKYLERPNVP